MNLAHAIDYAEENGTDTFEELVEEFSDWTHEQNLLEGDAMDLLYSDDITPAQREWLSDFVIRWEGMERRRQKIIRAFHAV